MLRRDAHGGSRMTREGGRTTTFTAGPENVTMPSRSTRGVHTEGGAAHAEDPRTRRPDLDVGAGHRRLYQQPTSDSARRREAAGVRGSRSPSTSGSSRRAASARSSRRWRPTSRPRTRTSTSTSPRTPRTTTGSSSTPRSRRARHRISSSSSVPSRCARACSSRSTTWSQKDNIDLSTYVPAIVAARRRVQLQLGGPPLLPGLVRRLGADALQQGHVRRGGDPVPGGVPADDARAVRRLRLQAHRPGERRLGRRGLRSARLPAVRDDVQPGRADGRRGT